MYTYTFTHDLCVRVRVRIYQCACGCLRAGQHVCELCVCGRGCLGICALSVQERMCTYARKFVMCACLRVCLSVLCIYAATGRLLLLTSLRDQETVKDIFLFE